MKGYFSELLSFFVLLFYSNDRIVFGLTIVQVSTPLQHFRGKEVHSYSWAIVVPKKYWVNQ